MASRPARPVRVKKLFYEAKIGGAVDHWFSQNRVQWQYALFTYYTLYAGRLSGVPLAAPDYTPLPDASKVARWLAAQKAGRGPAFLDTLASSAVRVCQAAAGDGLDIAGSFFRTGGEPLTVAKRGVIERTGSRVACHLSMSETGPVAIACADPVATDDMHLLAGKMAVLQRE